MHRKSDYTSGFLHRSCILTIVIVLMCTFLLVLLQSQESAISGSPEASRLQKDQFLYDSRTKRLPNAIIIGTRKSGTRALLKFLEVNPAIRSASSEVHFFDRAENYRRGLDWYRNQMPDTNENELTIEKSPAYFVTKEVPERVKAMNSSLKLIVIFRNPVTRLISDFSQLIANKLDHLSDESTQEGYSSSSIRQYWEDAALEFERHVLRSDGSINDQRRMVKIGMYSLYLERWLTAFKRNQFHFVDGERLISEPHFELQKLESFLGLKPVIKPENFVFSAKKGFFCLSSSNRTAEGTVIKGAMNPICLSKSKGRRHVTVREELRRKLVGYYAPFNEYLFSLTNINLNQ